MAVLYTPPANYVPVPFLSFWLPSDRYADNIQATEDNQTIEAACVRLFSFPSVFPSMWELRRGVGGASEQVRLALQFVSFPLWELLEGGTFHSKDLGELGVAEVLLTRGGSSDKIYTGTRLDEIKRSSCQALCPQRGLDSVGSEVESPAERWG